MTDPIDPQRLGLAIIHDVGLDWLRHDALDRLEIAYGWLRREGASPIAVADYLRQIAELLDSDPIEHLRAALRRIENDARTALEAVA